MVLNYAVTLHFVWNLKFLKRIDFKTFLIGTLAIESLQSKFKYFFFVKCTMQAHVDMLPAQYMGRSVSIQLPIDAQYQYGSCP